MTDRELLEMIATGMQCLQTDMTDLKKGVKVLNDKVEDLTERVEVLEGKVEVLTEKVEDLTERIEVIEGKVEGLEENQAHLSDKVETLVDKVDALQKEVSESSRRIKNVEMILETETNPGIRIIAEGHSDLYRKLLDAVKSEQEKELLQIRMLHLETAFREMKDKMTLVTA